MKIEFTDREYRASHLKAPKGYGRWLFSCEGYVFDGQGTLAEAKKQVKEKIKAVAPEGYSGTVYASILP